MKTLSKIIMAVVALAVISCTTDTTEDLGVKLGADGQTKILLSLGGGQRTHLGDKVEDIYPLYWSNGDQIAVNGIASEPLTEEAHGKAAATFTVSGGLTYPLNIVYPAPAEGAVVAEGLQAITFPATQSYTVGSFAEGAVPMYAYVAAAEEQIQLQHLAGILRLAVKGNGEKITSIVATSESGAIAGNFAVDCTNGALVAQEEAGNTVSVTFAEPLELGEEAQPIYISVPAGAYGLFTITLHTATDKMVVKFDSSAKPITAGKVREFNEFAYTPNTTEESNYFEIDSKEALIKFANAAPTLTVQTEAKVTAPIDMTGYDWTPIEGFAYTFDGGEHEIKGLNAPLFGSTSGTIKNVKLTEVNMTSNGRLIMGTIVCALTSNGLAKKASLSNCSASGTFTVSNPNWVPTDDQDKDATIVNYGGLVGKALAADISNSTNSVAIVVNQLQQKGSTKVVYSSIGGIVACSDVVTLENSEEIVTTITDCTNDAAISYIDATSEESKALVNGPRLGGILGCGIKGTELVRCENTANGNILLNSYFYGGGGASGGIPIGGVVGYTGNGVVNSCTNRGNVEVDGTLKAINLGGVGGFITYCWNDNLQNYGAVTLKESARVRGVAVGGVAGMFYGNGNNTDHTFKNCTNYGPVNVLASHEENFALSTTTNSPFYYRIGGITGFGRTKTTGGCTNNGDITISGNIKIAANSEYKEEALVIAGCIGFKTSGHPAGKWENNGDILVDATFTFDDDAAAIYHPIAISGVFGPQPSNPDEGYNNGNITFNGKYEGSATVVEIGGIYAGGQDTNGYNNKTPIKAKNTGNITIGDDAVISSALYLGGIIANTAATTAPTSLVNEGDITISEKVTIGGLLYAGGAYGHFRGGNIKNVSNSGDISIYGSVNGRACVGGICVLGVTGKSATDITNTGNIIASGTYKKGVYAGGVFSELAKGDTGLLTRVNNGELGSDGKPVANKGKITMSGLYDNDTNSSGQSALIIGGICGGTNYDRRPGSMNDCHNYGTIDISGTIKGRSYISGFSMACMSAGKTITNCSQEGDITFSGKLPNTTNGQIFLTGFAYTVDKAFTVTNFQNKGNITITEEAEIAEAVYMMGYGYRNSSVTYDGCSFSGNITHNGKQTANTVYMSGLAGERFSAIIKNGFTNSGDIIFGGTYSGGGILYISGLGPLYSTPTLGGTILNTGKIGFTGKSTHASSQIRIGGLFANIPAAATTVDGTAEGVDFVNKSDIVASGTSAGSITIGGIAATTSATITAAKSYTNIEAGENAVVGWITGSARAEGIIAKNCGVGGMRITGWDTEDDTPRPEGDRLDSGNFFDFIYGSVDWTGVTDYDGCSLITASDVNY